mmetsp:Transcript_6817/g.26346  ORF Transcript_6817/g.26346 Transcript_6817/m.26346 type:complete len:235 (-) Transcript_6817:959-1663(-)
MSSILLPTSKSRTLSCGSQGLSMKSVILARASRARSQADVSGFALRTKSVAPPAQAIVACVQSPSPWPNRRMSSDMRTRSLSTFSDGVSMLLAAARQTAATSAPVTVVPSRRHLATSSFTSPASRTSNSTRVLRFLKPYPFRLLAEALNNDTRGDSSGAPCRLCQTCSKLYWSVLKPHPGRTLRTFGEASWLTPRTASSTEGGAPSTTSTARTRPSCAIFRDVERSLMSVCADV